MDYEYQLQDVKSDTRRKRFVVLGVLLMGLGLIFIIVAATTPKGKLIEHAPRRPNIPSVFTAEYVIDDLDEDDGTTDPGDEMFEFRGTVQRDNCDDPKTCLHWHYFDKESRVDGAGKLIKWEIEFQLQDGQLYQREATDDGSGAWNCAELGTPVPKSISGALSSMGVITSDAALPAGKFACDDGETAWSLKAAGVRYVLCADEEGTPKSVTDNAHFVLHVTKWSPGSRDLPKFVVPEGTPACDNPNPSAGFTLPDKFTFDYSIRGVDDEDDIEQFTYAGRAQKDAGDDIDSFRFHYNETEVIKATPGGLPAGTHIIEFQYFHEDLYQRDPENPNVWTCAPLGVPLPKSVATVMQSVASAEPDADHPCPDGGAAWKVSIAQVPYNFCTDAKGFPSSVWTDNFVMTITNFIPDKTELPPFVPPPDTPKDCPDS